MNAIHYATGGLITPEMSEFSTLCGRKFPTGGKDLMDSGYAGRQRVTCEDCNRILTLNENTEKFLEKFENLLQEARRKPQVAHDLMYAFTKLAQTII